jgi:hypothetical protein
LGTLVIVSTSATVAVVRRVVVGNGVVVGGAVVAIATIVVMVSVVIVAIVMTTANLGRLFLVHFGEKVIFLVFNSCRHSELLGKKLARSEVPRRVIRRSHWFDFTFFSSSSSDPDDWEIFEKITLKNRQRGLPKGFPSPPVIPPTKYVLREQRLEEKLLAPNPLLPVPGNKWV